MYHASRPNEAIANDDVVLQLPACIAIFWQADCDSSYLRRFRPAWIFENQKELQQQSSI